MIIISLQNSYSSPINKFKRSIMKHHYKTNSLLTLLFVALLFTTSNINAQVSQNIVEYKGSKVVANSVICLLYTSPSPRD